MLRSRGLKPLQRLFGRQNRKGAGALSCLGQLQHQVVAADQHVGVACQRQFQKHLVIRIATLGQLGGSLGDRVSDPSDPAAVGVEQLLPSVVIEPELRIACHPRQFGQRPVVRQTDHRAGFDRSHQRCERGSGKVKQIHHHVGIQHQTWQARLLAYV